MDINLLSSINENDYLIDKFESFVWTDRYSSCGDFVLVMKADKEVFTNLRNTWGVGFSGSKTVMLPETIDVKDGMMTVKGRSFDSFFENRSNKKGSLSVDEDQYTGTAAQIAINIVNRFCIDPNLAGAVNVIPRLTIDYNYPMTEVLDVVMKRDNVYNLIKTICDTSQLGFKIELNAAKQLVFKVYQGIDRSTRLAGDNYRAFSEDLANLEEQRYLESNKMFKNHARVFFGDAPGVDVYAPGTPETVSGLKRRTLILELTDLPQNIAPGLLPIILRERGKQALANANNKYYKAVDGKIPEATKLSPDYNLGDIVAVKNDMGVSTRMRIVENVWSIDQNGSRTYPSFEAVT